MSTWPPVEITTTKVPVFRTFSPAEPAQVSVVSYPIDPHRRPFNTSRLHTNNITADIEPAWDVVALLTAARLLA